MFEKLSQMIESHPVISSVLVGGVGILVTVYFVQKYKSGQNSVTGVPTDAAGNPLTNGMTVSPPLSNGDLSTMLQDMEQQILNWEQQFQQDHSTTGNGNSSGNNAPTISQPPILPPRGVNPSPTPWWKSILTTNPDTRLPLHDAQSWFKVPASMSENAIAGLFHESWTDIAYNPNNAGLFGGSFLAQSYNQKGNNIIPAGTYTWIATTRIQ